MDLLQLEQRASLKDGLSRLPAPRNDYEIVIPDQEGASSGTESQTESADVSADFVEDQADIDARREEEIARKR